MSQFPGAYFYGFFLAFYCYTRYNINNMLPAYKVYRVLRQYRSNKNILGGSCAQNGLRLLFSRGSKGEEK